MPKILRSKKIKLLFLMLLFFLIVGNIWTTNPLVFQTIPRREALQVDPAELRSRLEKLVGPPPYRSVENWERLESAGSFIRKVWEEQGYQVTEQTFQVDGRTARNLIVSYSSESKASHQPRLVVGAHYDVCMDLPGADDNASGVVGLLEITRLFQQLKPIVSRRIDFIAYTLEEPPYFDTESMGSLVHAKSLKVNGDRVDLMISLEMIGFFSDEINSQNFPFSFLRLNYPSVGNFIAVVGSNSEWSEVRKIKSSMQAQTGLPVFSINTFEAVPGVGWSDHRSYWQLGIPAVMVTDTAYLRNKNYHQETDTPETLDYRRMAEVVKAVYGALINY